MINFLSSPLWFSHFRSLPVILSSNCPSLCSLFLNSLPTYNNLLFDLPFPLISSWPTFCIFLLMPIPSFSNYFFSHPSFFTTLYLYFSTSFVISDVIVCLLSSPLLSFFTGPEHILDATSTVCYATYGMFLNQLLLCFYCHMSSFPSGVIFSIFQHSSPPPLLHCIPASHLCV